MKPANWLESVNCAIEGVLWAAKTQRHMLYHFVAAFVVLLAALILKVTPIEFILIVVAATFVLFAELFNTAIEVLVDMVSPDFHPLAKRVKDVAAGGVLVAALGAVVAGYFALVPYLFVSEKAEGSVRIPGEVAVVSAVAVIILVVLLKARVGKGSPLHGGMPSGHAAVSFSIATSIAFSDTGTVLTILALLLAGMVSQSRLLLGIHSLREVLLGALLGTVVTFVIHFVLA